MEWIHPLVSPTSHTPIHLAINPSAFPMSTSSPSTHTPSRTHHPPVSPTSTFHQPNLTFVLQSIHCHPFIKAPLLTPTHTHSPSTNVDIQPNHALCQPPYA